MNPSFNAAEKFFSYYGTTDYADQFVQDALNGTGVWDGLTSAGYSGTSYVGTVDDARWQAVKKGTAYMNVPMYALYEFFRRAHQVRLGLLLTLDIICNARTPARSHLIV